MRAASDRLEPKGNERPPQPPPDDSATVDLAAINVFPSNDGIKGVIRNLGTRDYRGDRRARISLSALKKGGGEFQQTLGTTKVPAIPAGKQEFVSFPTPPEFARAREYRLTLTISGGDGDAANDSKVNATPGFPPGGASSGVDLEAAEVKRFSEGGVGKMRGVVRNVGSQNYLGGRAAKLYFVDQTGGQAKVTHIVSVVVGDIAAGGQWEVVGDVPANLKKVKTYTLKLIISAGDDNSANDEKSKKFVALDDN